MPANQPDRDEDSTPCSPIGVVRTPFRETDDVPRQGQFTDARGELELDAEFEPGLAGLEPGHRLVVVWYAHRADRDRLRFTGRDGRGVFTTRSPARPNPICLTTCRVVEVDGRRVVVDGVDMLDGTPVLDLKPPLRDE